MRLIFGSALIHPASPQPLLTLGSHRSAQPTPQLNLVSAQSYQTEGLGMGERTNPVAITVWCGKLTFHGLSSVERVTLDAFLASGCPWWHSIVAHARTEKLSCPMAKVPMPALWSGKSSATFSSCLRRRNSDFLFFPSFLSAWPSSGAGSAYRTCCAAGELGELCLFLLQLCLTNTYLNDTFFILCHITRAESLLVGPSDCNKHNPSSLSLNMLKSSWGHQRQQRFRLLMQIPGFRLAQCSAFCKASIKRLLI